MGTILPRSSRPDAPRPVYSGLQVPYSVLQTNASRLVQPMPVPIKHIPAGFVLDDLGLSLTVEPVALPSPVPGGGDLTCVHKSHMTGSLLVGTADGKVYSSNDFGATWTQELAANDTGCRINTICSEYLDPYHYDFCCTDGGSGNGRVYRRDVGGGSWTLMYTHASAPKIKAMAAMAGGGLAIVTGGGASALLELGTSNGSTWTLKVTMSSPEGIGFAECGTGSTIVAVCGGASGTYRAYYTTNGGVNWTTGATLTYPPIGLGNNKIVGWLDYVSGQTLCAIVDSQEALKVWDSTDTWTATPILSDVLPLAYGNYKCLYAYRGAAYAMLRATSGWSGVGNVVLKYRPYYTGSAWAGRWVQIIDDAEWCMSASSLWLKHYYWRTNRYQYFISEDASDRSIYVASRRQFIY